MRWVVAAIVVSIGCGVGIGWMAWGRPLGRAESRLGELERVAGELERELRESEGIQEQLRAENRVLAERQQELVAEVGAARREVEGIREVGIRAGAELTEAIREVRSLGELLDEIERTVDRLFERIEERDPGADGVGGVPGSERQSE